ncbi:MAG: ubiquinone/menaquinone biosynthesis methyltransferase [Gammaproteobacteria bacterium]|nr:ubiquinone/menaquinone biosynthesis methyltransferase [Gammaproteobacteria bacterium]MDE0259242.1 ubiquinone/menaquinone biosynthesis methyltransferase [Gammaproteobacteria bacterium]
MMNVSGGQPSSGEDRARQVHEIFSRIAPRYDLLNRVLSLSVDRWWRRRAVRALDYSRHDSARYLDACAGTCDLAIELATRPDFRGRVVALDFAEPMLRRGGTKSVRLPVHPLCGDAQRLPFADESFDGAMVAFGVRNLSHLDLGLAELRRVLRDGSPLVVLEFTTPPNPIVRAAYLWYFRHILPAVGRIVSGHRWAYSYLPASVGEFPGPQVLGQRLLDAGFGTVRWQLLTFGIAAIHVGVR